MLHSRPGQNLYYSTADPGADTSTGKRPVCNRHRNVLRYSVPVHGKERKNVKISTKGRYALRVMLDLALHDTGEFISLKDVSARQGITVKYLEQIMTVLTRAGYVRSQRGNNGGYRLAKDPAEYTAGDILRVMEGSLAPVACLEDVPNQCPRAESCPTLPFWEGLADEINTYVDSVTLQNLKDQTTDMAGNDFII